MPSENGIPSLSDDLSLSNLAKAVKELAAFSCLYRLSDIDFLSYASNLLKRVRNKAQTLLAYPPDPWSWNPGRKGLLTFQNYAEEVIENTQVVHQLLFQGAIQSASLLVEPPLLDQLKQTIQKLETSLVELDRYIQESTAALEDRGPLLRIYCQMQEEHSMPEHSNGKAMILQPQERSNGKTAKYE